MSMRVCAEDSAYKYAAGVNLCSCLALLHGYLQAWEKGAAAASGGGGEERQGEGA